MKKTILFGLLVLLLAVAGLIYAADHTDSPSVTGMGGVGTTSDITDVYAFESPDDATTMTFVLNIQGKLPPSSTASATFPANVLYEIAIDTSGDLKEDKVIQCIAQFDSVRVYDPVIVGSPLGLTAGVVSKGTYTDVAVTPYKAAAPIVATGSSKTTIFAGPRDDPFFFDLAQFKAITHGAATAFKKPGTDSFAGLNVMSLVIKMPKSIISKSATINVWAKTRLKN